MRELEQEFDVVDGSISGWLHDQAAWLDCMSKQGLLKFNNFVDRKAK
jgi:hypothetical protein